MPESIAHPADFKARSFHYRTLLADGAHFAGLSGCAIASSYGASIEEESARARGLGLIDLSPLPRTGFRGRRALEWLKNAGLLVGDQNNFSWLQENGSIVARLADTEALLLADLSNNSNTCFQLDDSMAREKPASCYHVPRRDLSAWFLVTGASADIMFAKICGVDMRRAEFPSGMVAQTSIARMNAICIRSDLGDMPAYHLIFDSASADYLWRALKDAMTEFDGKPVGYDAMVSIARA
jgi:sarcosine oxidase subunit gamma